MLPSNVTGLPATTFWLDPACAVGAALMIGADEPVPLLSPPPQATRMVEDSAMTINEVDFMWVV